MTPSRVALAELDNGVIWAQNASGNLILAAGATAFVYQYGTTTPISVFVGPSGGGTLVQPLTANAQGQLPGYVLAEQDVSVVATYGGVTQPAVGGYPLRAVDLVGTDGFIGGPGSIGISPDAAVSYQAFTTVGTLVVPAGVTTMRARVVGGGGGGAGGCSGTSTGSYVGGGAGAAGQVVDVEITVIPGNTLTLTPGSAGTNGTGGASGGNLGTGGGQGGTSTVVDTTASTTLASAVGGSGGIGPAASATASVGGGSYTLPGSSLLINGASPAGCGGSSNAVSTVPIGPVVGGAGGGAATTTQGGAGGHAQLTGTILQQSGTGTRPVGANGNAGQTATMPGCGGGGGGAGATAAGVGGNGGSGATGLIELWW